MAGEEETGMGLLAFRHRLVEARMAEIVLRDRLGPRRVAQEDRLPLDPEQGARRSGVTAASKSAAESFAISGCSTPPAMTVRATCPSGARPAKMLGREGDAQEGALFAAPGRAGRSRRADA